MEIDRKGLVLQSKVMLIHIPKTLSFLHTHNNKNSNPADYLNQLKNPPHNTPHPR